MKLVTLYWEDDVDCWSSWVYTVQALHVHLSSVCWPLRVGKHDVRGLSVLLIIWLCHHFPDPVAWSSCTSSPSHDSCQLIVINLDKDHQVRCSSCSPTKSPTSSNTTNSSTDNKTNEANTNKESSCSSCPGFLLPRAPTLVGGPWTCDSCNRTLGASAVQVEFWIWSWKITELFQKDRKVWNTDFFLFWCYSLSGCYPRCSCKNQSR